MQNFAHKRLLHPATQPICLSSRFKQTRWSFSSDALSPSQNLCSVVSPWMAWALGVLLLDTHCSHGLWETALPAQDSNNNALVWFSHLSLISQWKILESSCQEMMYLWSSALLTGKSKFKVYLDDFHLFSYLLCCGSIHNQGAGRDREERLCLWLYPQFYLYQYLFSL